MCSPVMLEINLKRMFQGSLKPRPWKERVAGWGIKAMKASSIVIRNNNKFISSYVFSEEL